MFALVTQALAICVELEEIYERESAKASEEQVGGSASAAEGDKNSGDDSDGSDEEDEDDDKVVVEDFAEVKLLQAVLSSAVEGDEGTSESFNATLALFRKALGASLRWMTLRLIRVADAEVVCVYVHVRLLDGSDQPGQS